MEVKVIETYIDPETCTKYRIIVSCMYANTILIEYKDVKSGIWYTVDENSLRGQEFLGLLRKDMLVKSNKYTDILYGI